MKKQANNKQKMVINNYEKEFKSFEEMVTEFKELHPEMKNIFPYDVKHAKDVADDVLEYFTKNAPNITEKTNLPVAISISKNRITLKTAKFFTVAWRFKFDKDGNISDLVATLTTFGREDGKNHDDLAALINVMTDPESEWKLVEYK